MKQCSECKKILKLNNKSGFCTVHYLAWWEKNKRNLSKKKETLKAWYLKNKVTQDIKSSNYRKENIDAIREYDRKRSKTIERKKAHKEYERKRLAVDPQFRLSKYLRNTIYVALVTAAEHKKAVQFLGCSISQYRKYLESKFKDGMSWDNYGDWHIDHIKPLVDFNLNNKEEFLKASHFSNTQPLWALENFTKRDQHKLIKKNNLRTLCVE